MIDFYIKENFKREEKFFNYLIKINQAHIIMLFETQIITQEDTVKLLTAFKEIERQGINNLSLEENLLDLYMNLESQVVMMVGRDVGGRIHTARSRNDIQSTLLRMGFRERMNEVVEKLLQVIEVMLHKASLHIETVMPGFTHVQPAQPITFGHYCMANVTALFRDIQRLEGAYERVNECPMGSAALAGTSFPINQKRVGELLGFDRISENTLDAVSSRDFSLEVIADLTIMMGTISRLAMDLILWGNWIYNLVEFDDSFSSISSIMPQKKNNVSAETIRAKSGMVYGELISTLSILRTLPWGVHRDLSFVNETSYTAFNHAIGVLSILKGIVETLKINQEVMFSLSSHGYTTATDLADLLVKESNIPFRTAYRIVGGIVNKAMENSLRCDSITTELVVQIAFEITGKPLKICPKKIIEALDPMTSVNAHQTPGGPSFSQTQKSIEKAHLYLQEGKERLMIRKHRLHQGDNLLQNTIEEIIC